MSLAATYTDHRYTLGAGGASVRLALDTSHTTASQLPLLTVTEAARLREFDLNLDGGDSKHGGADAKNQTTLSQTTSLSRPSRTHQLSRRLSDTLGFSKPGHVAEEPLKLVHEAPQTPPRTHRSAPHHPEVPQTPTKPRTRRFTLRKAARGIPFFLTSKSKGPPSYRDVELQQSWASIGIDIHDPKFGPKPKCTPQEWALAFDDFFGNVSRPANIGEGAKQHQGRRQQATASIPGLECWA
ncbi:hypothetical protein ACQY0O_006268 [Thecaphora frezii]